MPLSYDAPARLLTISTDSSTYQMKVDEYGYLLHLYYGSRAEGDLSYLVTYCDRSGMCGCPHDVADRTYSLDVAPQEFPFQGSGDMRSPALLVRDAEGTFGCDLRYKCHEIRPGKYDLPGLPAVYAGEKDDAETLSVTLADERLGLEVELLYGVLPELDIITRAAVVRNNGTGRVTVEKLQSACLDFVTCDLDVITFDGRHAMERRPTRRHLLNGSPDSRFRSRPLAAAQPVQLRLSGIRSGVFLNHLQLGRQDVKVAALGVLDLDIVLHDLVYFYLLDSPVDAKAVILMDHVVSGLQLGKALYLLAFIDLFLFPFLPFPSENIGLGKHRKADQRVLVAPVQASVHHHNFRWIYHPVRVLAVKAVQLLLLQIRRQSFSPGPGGAHQNHGIFFPFPSLQIL